MASAPEIQRKRNFSISPERARARARFTGFHGRPVDDPERVEAKCDLVEIGLREHITKTLAAAPPLSPERLARIAALFQAGGA